jgi:hypothetical protein
LLARAPVSGVPVRGRLLVRPRAWQERVCAPHPGFRVVEDSARGPRERSRPSRRRARRSSLERHEAPIFPVRMPSPLPAEVVQALEQRFGAVFHQAAMV